jgi:hypothetical protein
MKRHLIYPKYISKFTEYVDLASSLLFTSKNGVLLPPCWATAAAAVSQINFAGQATSCVAFIAGGA